nr:hypothetical protein [Tanacetum cinerariifolium]
MSMGRGLVSLINVRRMGEVQSGTPEPCGNTDVETKKSPRHKGGGLKGCAEQRTIHREERIGGSAIERAAFKLLRQRLRRRQRGQRTADRLAVLNQVPAGQQTTLTKLGGNCAADNRHDLNLGHNDHRRGSSLAVGRNNVAGRNSGVRTPQAVQPHKRAGSKPVAEAVARNKQAPGPRTRGRAIHTHGIFIPADRRRDSTPLLSAVLIPLGRFHVGHRHDLPAAIAGMRSLGIRGCGVSMPFKEAAIELVDEMDASAAAIQSINTIV